jgi:hypothetical protein
VGICLPFRALGPSPATDFFQRLIRNRISAVESNRIAGLSLQDCFDQQALLLTVLGEDGDDMTLAMDHGDYKPDNIIVDENYTIKGYR